MEVSLRRLQLSVWDELDRNDGALAPAAESGEDDTFDDDDNTEHDDQVHPRHRNDTAFPMRGERPRELIVPPGADEESVTAALTAAAAAAARGAARRVVLPAGEYVWIDPARAAGPAAGAGTVAAAGGGVEVCGAGAERTAVRGAVRLEAAAGGAVGGIGFNFTAIDPYAVTPTPNPTHAQHTRTHIHTQLNRVYGGTSLTVTAGVCGHTHTRTHARTHARTHTHTHTQLTRAHAHARAHTHS
jgi:hypothetical protein